jgi:hypothetical protein
VQATAPLQSKTKKTRRTAKKSKTRALSESTVRRILSLAPARLTFSLQAAGESILVKTPNSTGDKSSVDPSVGSSGDGSDAPIKGSVDRPVTQDLPSRRRTRAPSSAMRLDKALPSVSFAIFLYSFEEN